MMNNHKNRERKVNVEILTIKQAEKLESQLTAEISRILDEASEKCNKMLNIYGLETVISFNIGAKTDKKSEKTSKVEATS